MKGLDHRGVMARAWIIQTLVALVFLLAVSNYILHSWHTEGVDMSSYPPARRRDGLGRADRTFVVSGDGRSLFDATAAPIGPLAAEQFRVETREQRRAPSELSISASAALTGGAAPVEQRLWRPKCKDRLTKERKAARPAFSTSGAWTFEDCEYKYFLDAKLLAGLVMLMAGGEVVELGAGCGCYTGALIDSQQLMAVAAYDGIPTVSAMTEGLVSNMDLSQDQRGVLNPHDWTVCLEVGEHVPKQYEKTVLANIVWGVRRGVILSWAMPGQVGEGHVNLRSNEYIINQMNALGFRLDEPATVALRSTADLPWFKNTLLAFRRASSAVAAWRPKCTAYTHDAVIPGDEGVQPLDTCEGSSPSLRFDSGLVEGLRTLFLGGDVLELAAGCGCYTAELMKSDGGYASPSVSSISAFDSAVNINELTSGLVFKMRLAQDSRGLIGPHDWTLSWASGDSVLLANVNWMARQGVVLNKGHGHWRAIQVQLAAKGFNIDHQASSALRQTASVPQLAERFLVFRRQAVTEDAEASHDSSHSNASSTN